MKIKGNFGGNYIDVDVEFNPLEAASFKMDYASPDFAEAVRRVLDADERAEPPQDGYFEEQAPEAPPAEDKLARAREKYDESVTYVSMLEAAIRERDERLSQMMTVEEVCKWNSQLTEEDENYDNYLRQKIKERNEGARG